MKQQLVFFFIMILAASLASCQPAETVKTVVVERPRVPVESKSPQSAATFSLSSEQYARQQATLGQADVDPQTGLNRMVIYNATLDLIVRDTAPAITDTLKIVQEAGGYVTTLNSYRDNEQLRATLTARVPSDRLIGTLEKLRKIALVVDREGLTGEDVTDQYTDLEARLRNMEVAEQRYLAILNQADKIEDILAVQKRLDEIRGEIEQTKGRMEYLSKSAAFATITISLTPDVLARPISIGGWRPQGTARNAFEALLWALKTLGDILIWTAICILPMAALLGVPIYLAIRWARKRMRKPRPPESK